MTREEAIKNYIMPALKRTWNDDRCIEIISAIEQEPSEDEYIKVPKKALKYRTAGMVAYNTEWLKSHFDIERIVICGAQHPCEDAVSKQMIKEQMFKYGFSAPDMTVTEFVEDLPSVNSQKPTEWQQDREILKAYSDGANEMLDQIRAEIAHLHDWAFNREEILRIIDKYKADKDGEE